ncbi:MAG: UDP-N-acetylmuramoyl-L-alanine--D-glutamate ligase [Sedimentisphaerales bacterium]|nr:UDP-N-acetylmuramoyl-L-alanine--D-glutamate ligase [Sedimentisphaerales bacterium]
MNRFGNKRVLIMGLGRFGGGKDSAVFACRHGGKVTVTDLSREDELAGTIKSLENFDINYVLGKHDKKDFENTDVLIVNPAVKPDNEFIAAAKKAGRVITSQIELFFELCPCRIVAITGANGKSTTTALTYHILNNARPNDGGYENVWLGGNIGNLPLLELLDKIGPDDIAVLEVSSFQIEQLACSGRSCHAALITNLTANHLDRHGSFEAYCGAKEKLFSMQKCDESNPCVSIFNGEDEITKGWFDKYGGESGRKCFKFFAGDITEELKKHFVLAGKMNLSNLAAARAIAMCFGIGYETIVRALDSFEALPCRLELISEIGGVRWYNDSISTTPVSTIGAIEAFDEPKIIIAGGYDKGLSFEELGEAIAKRVKAAILIGATASKIEDEILKETDSKIVIKKAVSMGQAVELAEATAVSGDVVLLSPACASYDMFENFRHRADVFIDHVKNMGKKL